MYQNYGTISALPFQHIYKRDSYFCKFWGNGPKYILIFNKFEGKLCIGYLNIEAELIILNQ